MLGEAGDECAQISFRRCQLITRVQFHNLLHGVHSLSLCFHEKLLEQPSQLKRRSASSVGHRRNHGVIFVIERPIDDRRDGFAGRAALAFLPSWSDIAGRPAAASGEELPGAVIVARKAWIITAGNVAIAVAGDDVKLSILLIRLEYAAEVRRPAIDTVDAARGER